ncbi:PhzF family phenazine biosynthesis protein [Alicyclobacillus vulcanalis]|uniref:Phenazine biosynthesis protein PhzF family n=1 Tax=Alicyclobacillus vulcanalis TaxID=252246 RepID=A0A1N7JM88_9BACL|nr:PhzF family phenazine biosynthesis protein [Alicyclobacillus vulcanalis]SIS50473.1 phenazine biosynthesis protein PhzF family [Alicyclobacillus vulcanalis]
MREIEVFQVDAFTEEPFTGNPAGVVIDGGELPRDLRQRIAREMNCSETAFVVQYERDRFRFQYHTPEAEVDLCGHATIAALHLLRERQDIIGDIVVETRAGLLPMRIDEKGPVWMRQAEPKFRDVPDDARRALLAALAMEEGDLADELPFALASTGIWQVMVPIKSRDRLFALAPDQLRLREVSRSLGAICVHVYALDPAEAPAVAVARDFAPAVGVAEDPHTGTAAGALASLLVDRGIVAAERELAFEQGANLGRPGLILARVEAGPPMRTWVGGHAVTMLRGEMRVAK